MNENQQPTRRTDEAVVRIQLSDDQRQEVREKTGKEAEAIELTVSELEERIAPRGGGPLYQ